MSAGEPKMRDLVNVHVTAELPIRTRALPFADRIEVRFGNAFPVALLIDRAAIDRLGDAIQAGRIELEAATKRKTEG